MHAQHWGMAGWPFENRLDTRWFVESPVHEEALARILFLIEKRRRFGVLTGPPGCGKSLLLRIVVEQSRRAHRQVAHVDLAGLDGYEMVWQLSAALRVAPRPDDSLPRLWMRVNDHLAGQQAAARSTVMLFDHADSATNGCLNQLERLVHRGAGCPARVTIILAGEANDLTLRWPGIRGLADLWIRMAPFNREQSHGYVERLLEKAHCHAPVFDTEALDSIFEETEGVPRDVNRLCELSMLAAMGEGWHTVPAGIVRSVVRELRSVRAGTQREPAGQVVS